MLPPLPRRVAGLATTAELLTAMTRKQLDTAVRKGRLIRVWHGVYSTTEPDLMSDCGHWIWSSAGMLSFARHTAATLYGFGVHDSPAVHVLDPVTHFGRPPDSSCIGGKALRCNWCRVGA